MGDEENTEGWSSRLTHSDVARLALARALVMNPEVLVVHIPTANFNDTEASAIIDLLREHVDRKGLELDESERRFRRPRTVFMTSSRIIGVQKADAVYKVFNQSVRQI